jgi:hypothetical protein
VGVVREEASGTRRGVLSVYAGCISFSAFAGGVGLACGALAMGQSVNARLPLQSPVLGGLALIAVVGVPTAVVSALAWQGRPLADPAATVAGVLLILWIIVEVAFIREFSFLQVVFAAAGLSLIVLALSHAQSSNRVDTD